MLAHLFNLLGRAFMAIPTSIGSNWLGLLVPIFGALLAEVIGICIFGWQTMRANWKKATGLGFASMGVLYTALFCWCLVKTTYADHQSLVGNNQALQTVISNESQHEKDSVNEVRSALTSKLSDLKESCAELTGGNRELERRVGDQQNTINNCQDQAIKLLVPIQRKISAPIADRHSAFFTTDQSLKVVLIVNMPISAARIVLSCDRDIQKPTVQILGSGIFDGAISNLGKRQAQIIVNSAWGPDNPLLISIDYRGVEGMQCYFNLV